MYNLYNLEPKFKNYLNAVNISPVSLRNYLSDIRHFLGWMRSSDKDSKFNDPDSLLLSLDHETIEEYKNCYKQAVPLKTVNRRLSAIRKFFNFCQAEGLININPAKNVGNIPLILKAIKKPIILKSTQPVGPPNFVKMPQPNSSHFTLPYNLFTTVLLSLAISTFLIFLTTGIITDKKTNIAVLPQIQKNNRYLAFNGKISDSVGNPLTTKTDVIFSLYNSANSSTPIYITSCIGENGAIIPDANGNVRIIIGKDCDGAPIPSNIFNDNANLYLGIKVSSDPEMKPRQHIPNVGYARNADYIQGFSIGSENLSVPYINQQGNLLIASSNPGIRSLYESSNFTISSADTIALQSASLGDVILQATESGKIKLRTGGISDASTNFILNEFGNVGIGTIFPSYKLEVSGDIKITDGNKLILANSSGDPVGINGSMYYNSSTNKFRCFENNSWRNCFDQTEIKTVGGIDGKIISPIQENQINQNTENRSQKSENSDKSDFRSISPPSSDFSDKGPLASLIIQNLDGKTVATIDPAGNATFSGTLTTKDASISGRLIAKEIESDTLNTLRQSLNSRTSVVEDRSGKTAEVSERLASELDNIQSLLSEIRSEPIPDPAYYQKLQTLEDLTVTRSTNLYKLYVTGSSTIGNLLIENNSVLSLGGDLKLSALNDGKIKLFDDAVIISNDGTIQTKGRLIAEAGISTNKIEIADKYLLNEVSSASASLETNTAIAGNGSIAANSPDVIIYNENVKKNSLIYLTPSSSSSSILSLAQKQTCDKTSAVSSYAKASENKEEENGLAHRSFSEDGKTAEVEKSVGCKSYFKVALNQPVDYTITFNWLIID